MLMYQAPMISLDEIVETMESIKITEEETALPSLDIIIHDLDEILEDITTIDRLEEAVKVAETFFVTVYPYKNFPAEIEIELSREQAEKIVADIKAQIRRHRKDDEDGVFNFVINVQRWDKELNFFPSCDDDSLYNYQ